MFSRRAALSSCLLVSLAAASALGAQPGKGDPAAESRRMAQEAADLEQKIGELILPLNGYFDPARYGALVRDHAARLAIAEPSLEWDEGERLKLADGSASDLKVYRIQISGSAPFASLYSLLDYFWYGGGSGVKLEKLKLEAVPGNQVSYALTYAAVHVDVVPPAEPKKSTPAEALAWVAAQNERRRQMVRLLEEVGKDTQSRSLLDSVADLTAALDSGAYGVGERRAVGLGRLELGAAGTVEMEGAALGKSAETALAAAIAEAGFASFKVDFRAPAGPCRPFTAIVTPGQAPEEEYQLESVNGLFDAGIAGLCRASASPPKKIALSGKAGESGIDLRMVDVDWMEALEVIFTLLEEPFLAAPEIPPGRVSFEVKGASRDELVASLSQAGLQVGPGTPHWVVAAGSPLPAMPAQREFEGEAAIFELRRSGLPEFLCSIGALAGEKEVWASSRLEGEVRLFADLPWDQVLATVLAARGLVHQVDGERLLIGPGPADTLAGRDGMVQLCVGGEETESKPFAGSRLAEMDFDEYQLTPEDLQLVGLGRKGALWLGAAYGPNRKQIYLLPNFGTFAGGSLSVGPQGVSIDKGEGEPARLALPKD